MEIMMIIYGDLVLFMWQIVVNQDKNPCPCGLGVSLGS